MTIVNDVVTFQAADFSALSALAVAAIQHQAGTTAAMRDRLGKQVTAIISSAKENYIRETAGDNPDVSLLIRKFANADAPTLAAAADEIAALSDALGPLP